MNITTTFSFTEKRIKSVKPETRTRTFSDKRLNQLKLVVTPNGTKTYYVRFKVNGISKQFKLGRQPSLTIEEARFRATEYLNNAKAARHVTEHSVQKLQKPSDSFSFNDAFNAYFDNHLKHLSTGRDKQHNLARHFYMHLQEELGHIDLVNVNQKWITKYLKVMYSLKGYAIHDKCVIVLKAMLNYCLTYEEDYPLDYNPCAQLKKVGTEPRSRYLTYQEGITLLEKLDDISHPQHTDLFKIALFTGARISNVKAMRWDELDLNAELWCIPAIKTKTKKTYYLPIVSLALTILIKRRKEFPSKTEFVFPSQHSKSGHVMGGDQTWKEAIKAAGLYSPNRELRVRQHDLRRTFATWQAISGVDINVISKSLGHCDIKSTQVYAHLNTARTKDAIEGAFANIK